MKCSNCGLHEVTLAKVAGNLFTCPGCNHQFVMGRHRYTTTDGLQVEYIGEDVNGHRQFQAPDGTILTAD